MVAVSFYPALSGGFVMDDDIFTEAPAVLTWSGLWDIWFSPAEIERERHYWPVVYTTFWLEHKLWVLDPFGYHVVNVLLYMVNVLLLWHLLRRLPVPGAWVVAAVFAVHPMHVESVAWIMGRKDLLSGLFYMAAALCWIRSIDGLGESRGRSVGFIGVPHPGLYVAALGLFVAAMLSKSVAVTLPVAFAILLWWKNGRVTWADAWRIAPFLLVALFVAVADVSYYTSRRELSFDYSLLDRMLIAARALWFYAGKLMWPTDLAVIYPLWDIDIADPRAWGYLVAAAGLASLLWFGRHRLGRGPLAGAVFLAVTLSPVLGFVDFGYMGYSLVAERYAYLAGIGVLAVLVGAAAHGAGRLPNPAKIAASCVLVGVFAVFGKLTWDQAGIYPDKITFYNHIISLNPEALVYRNLALALNDAGRSAEALAASRIAVEQRPDSARAHNSLGVALFGLDRLDEAAESFRRAAELAPGHEQANRNMARTRMQQRRWAESARWYRRALDINPESAELHADMGEALFRSGRHEQALNSLETAFSLAPDAMSVSACHFLAEALRKQGRNEEAIERYRDVLEMDPDFDYAHAGVGYALVQLKRYQEALEPLARSISLQPESPAAVDRHLAMGQALEALDRTEEAANHFVRGVGLAPKNVTLLNALAWLRFRQERYEDALGLYETLIEVGYANAQVHVNMAAALDYLGRPADALRSLETALSLDPALADTGIEEMREVLRQKQQ